MSSYSTPSTSGKMDCLPTIASSNTYASGLFVLMITAAVCKITSSILAPLNSFTP